MEIENHTKTNKAQELNLDIRAFVQDKLDEGVNVPVLATMLIVEASNLGLQLGADPKAVILTSLNAITMSIERNLESDNDNDFELIESQERLTQPRCGRSIH